MPEAEAGPTFITAYGEGGFRIVGERHEGAVLIVGNAVHAWDVSSSGEITAESLKSIGQAAEPPDVLILGCGAETSDFPDALRHRLKGLGLGLVVEIMGTGAACRTFNLLRAEGRAVAAALIAVA